jgi:phospholipase/lecithinase/hemolysin
LNVDPDTYLFWDSLHPTTRGHNLLAQQAREILAGSATEEDADAVSISVPR